MSTAAELWLAYKLRLRRKKYLVRAWRRRRELNVVADRTHQIAPADILCFSSVRNEAGRLPFFLDHCRALGVQHFFFVANDCTDGTVDLLRAQSDVSLWTTQASYKASRFGVDWLNGLQHHYAHGHWALTLDADEILVFPDCSTRMLRDLTDWLRAQRIQSFGAMMLDMYPQGRLDAATYTPGDAIWSTLTHFDPDGYTWEWQPKFQNISIRGGPRKRVFFASEPDHSPHLHKVPLIDWRRGMAYASSTHLALPRQLNTVFDARRNLPTGVLLHSKFLPEVISKSREEKVRGEHFTHPGRYGDYYDAVAAAPNLWAPNSVAYEGPDQLEQLGLMRRGVWRP